MAGQATNRRRQHYIDVARMLGYSIVPATDVDGRHFQYELWLNGERVEHRERVQHPNGTMPEWYMDFLSPRFSHIWQAAAYAIKQHGVSLATLEPPRKDGALGSSAPKIFLARNQSERTHHRTAKAAAQRQRNPR